MASINTSALEESPDQPPSHSRSFMDAFSAHSSDSTAGALLTDRNQLLILNVLRVMASHVAVGTIPRKPHVELPNVLQYSTFELVDWVVCSPRFFFGKMLTMPVEVKYDTPFKPANAIVVYAVFFFFVVLAIWIGVHAEVLITTTMVVTGQSYTLFYILISMFLGVTLTATYVECILRSSQPKYVSIADPIFDWAWTSTNGKIRWSAMCRI
jgi:hypothetical protein